MIDADSTSHRLKRAASGPACSMVWHNVKPPFKLAPFILLQVPVPKKYIQLVPIVSHIAKYSSSYIPSHLYRMKIVETRNHSLIHA